MSTPSLEERQVELEIESLVMGRRRYEERRQAEGESATLPGMEQTMRALPVLTQAIAEWVEKAITSAGRWHAASHYLIHIDPAEAAYLTIRHALDGAARRSKLNTVAVTLGSAVQDHIELMSMAQGEGTESKDEALHMRRLFKKVLDQVKKATTTTHRSNTWHHVLRKYRPNALKWSVEAKCRVGTLLIELFESSCTLIQTVRATEGRHDTPIYVQFTPEAAEWLADAHVRTSLWQPIHQPMLIPPRDWVSPSSGGYLTKAIKTKLVLTNSRGYLEELHSVDMPAVYNAVNTVQRTPWRINTAVLDVMREAYLSGPGFQRLFAEEAVAPPPRPAGLPAEGAELTEEQAQQLGKWKRLRAQAYAEEAHRKAKLGIRAQQMTVAQKFRDEKAIYFPHYLDFRGRIYPFATYLNPQGDDVARSLLQFANGKPLGARGVYWLKVHIANLAGVDKVSFADRVKWTDEHAEQILASASNPLGVTWWQDTENPWQMLAACFEFAGWTVQGNDYVSYLPIAMDGSCSGLQHFSAMLRDEQGGAQVNLVPADKPADVYTVVAKRVQSLVDSGKLGEAAVPWQNGKVSRKIAKKPTMTYCYSATQYGMAGQVEEELRKLGKAYLGTDVDTRAAATFIARHVRDAIGETVVAAKTAMDFLQTIAVLAAEKGLPIYWTAPSGFPVHQEYREPRGERINVFYGGLRLRLTITREGATIDKKRQAAGVAPNFVHACDSAHLMATVNLGAENGLLDWACIHDSFGVHAADVDTLHAVIREAFIEQYTPDVLARFRDEIIEQLRDTAPDLIERVPQVPPQGRLDLAAIRDSAYFFA